MAKAHLQQTKHVASELLSQQNIDHLCLKKKNIILISHSPQRKGNRFGFSGEQSWFHVSITVKEMDIRSD